MVTAGEHASLFASAMVTAGEHASCSPALRLSPLHSARSTLSRFFDRTKNVDARVHTASRALAGRPPPRAHRSSSTAPPLASTAPGPAHLPRAPAQRLPRSASPAPATPCPEHCHAAASRHPPAPPPHRRRRPPSAPERLPALPRTTPLRRAAPTAAPLLSAPPRPKGVRQKVRKKKKCQLFFGVLATVSGCAVYVDGGCGCVWWWWMMVAVCGCWNDVDDRRWCGDGGVDVVGVW